MNTSNGRKDAGTKLSQAFIYSAGVVLLLTGAAKLISSGGSARILETLDPITGLPFRELFRVVGAAELLASIACFACRDRLTPAGLVAWLASGFVLYRIGLLWVGYHKPCSCLGTFTDALHLSPQAADTLTKSVLAYLVVGGYACLWWFWKNRPSGAANASMTGQDVMPLWSGPEV